MRSPNVLLVEGNDDLHVVLHLLYQHGFKEALNKASQERYVIEPDSTQAGEPVHVKDKNGFDSILKDLHVELKPTYLRRLGVILDAALDLNARWQGVRQKLANQGYTNLPADPEPLGTVLAQAGKPIVGIWLMPDNKAPGCLEHFISSMIGERDRLWPHAQDSVDRIDEQDRRFSNAHAIKAKTHTWLAWQEEPGTRLGQALTKKYLDPRCGSATAFVSWVVRWLSS